jgi:hypothetical protein
MADSDTAELPVALRRIYDMTFASVYPHYVAKAEKKGRTKREVDQIIRWLTGYTQRQVTAHARKETTFEQLFAAAPAMNPDRSLITGVVCGVRVEAVDDPVVREVRFLDKLIDELVEVPDLLHERVRDVFDSDATHNPGDQTCIGMQPRGICEKLLE